MSRLAAALVAALLAACAGAPATPSSPAPRPADLSEPAARATLEGFALALEAGRWPEAWGSLSSRWRATTATPARLAADWRGAGPVAREAAGRVLALLRDGTTLTGQPGEGGGPLLLPVGHGRSARLVAEAEGGRWSWRVDALE